MLKSEHGYYDDLVVAAAETVKAGITQFLDDYVSSIDEALGRKLLTEADLDVAIRPNFRVMLRLGLLDPPDLVPHTRVGSTPPHELEAHRKLAHDVAAQSIVLLKNSRGLLPLKLKRPFRRKPLEIALLGRLADRVHQDWYSGTPPYHVTLEEGLRTRLADQVNLTVVTNNDTSEIVAAARDADLCVMCLGSHPTGDSHWAEVLRSSYGKEAVDRRTLELEEERLVREVFEVNPRLVLVLVSSFPYAINWSQENLPAILWTTHGGQEFGNAVASVLLGDVCPGGRLVQTWPKTLEQLPDILDYDIRGGRTYMYSKAEPLYPFGYGLSYTTFSYSALEVSDQQLTADGEITVSVTLENTGKCRGDEVIQIYARFLRSALERPLHQLVAFERITLESGEARTVKLCLPAERLAHWDVQQADFAVERGPVQLQLGRSSRDILLETNIEVT
jgi:beta-glucosidase